MVMVVESTFLNNFSNLMDHKFQKHLHFRFPIIIVCAIKNGGLVVGKPSTITVCCYTVKFVKPLKMRDLALIPLVGSI